MTLFVHMGRPNPQPTAVEKKTYPRAAVVRSGNSAWHILMYQDTYTANALTNSLGVLIFGTRHAAMTHAAREIHALRARRHPAGQSWLRGKGAER